MKRKIVTWMMVVAMMTAVIVPASAASPNCVQTNCRNIWQYLCDWWQTQPDVYKRQAVDGGHPQSAGIKDTLRKIECAIGIKRHGC